MAFSRHCQTKRQKNAKILRFYPIFHLLTPFFAYETYFWTSFRLACRVHQPGPRHMARPLGLPFLGRAPRSTSASSPASRSMALPTCSLGLISNVSKLLGDETLSKMVTDYSYSSKFRKLYFTSENLEKEKLIYI